MPLQKNQIITLSIERLSGDGSGVGHWEGEAVFVPGTAPGDVIRARIVKDCKRYAFGIVEAVETASPDRIPADCPVAGPCGGCSLRHLRYEAELQAKQAAVADAFRRIGGLDVPVEPILPSPEVDRYRNKVQYPVGLDKAGRPCIGFYAGRSHRIVPCADCKLQPAILNEIGSALCGLFDQYGIQPYDEASGAGLVRHIFLRRGAHSGQIMVCLVCTRPRLPHAAELTAALCARFRDIRTVLLNVNPDKTNVILGRENRVLYGPGFIEDTLCGVPVRLGPFSFYQVNTPGAEQLYGVAAAYADPSPNDLLLDLYCGMGTIGLSMAGRCRALVGVEVVPEAIESAKANAARMGDAIAAKSRFFCADAGEAARDAARLAREGYRVEKVQPVDMFPRTGHVECVIKLSKGSFTPKKIRVEFSLEDMDLSSLKKGATYEEIKDYVKEQTGLNVTPLYIAQVKQKCGIIERECYNKPKSENAKQPQCPPEKEKAIREALKHFQMI